MTILRPTAISCLCFMVFVAGLPTATYCLAAEGPQALQLKRSQFEQAALTREGSPERGSKLFLDEEKTRCITCHQIGNRGKMVGPDISQIGGKFDRPHLVESLLDPSRQIVEGYRTSVLVTRKGQILTGIVKRETDEHLLVVDAQGVEHVLEKHRVEQTTTTNSSLMPDNLLDSVSPEEFTDLIAYLETLRPGGKATPGAATTGRMKLPAGFVVEPVATRLTGSTAIETLPDGRVLVCEQIGRLRVVKDNKLLPAPMLELPVDWTWERGLIGVAADPDFPGRPYVYVCYVAATPYPHHRVSRFTVEGDQVVPGSEKILLRGDDQTKLGGHVPAGHQGGALHFSPDRHLFVAIGEQTAEAPAQRLDSFLGKILRIDPDGNIPGDNPFVDQTEGKYRAIWARGCRNPFTFAIHPRSGILLVNDVGGKYEEINRGVAGANYGWPVADHGPTADARFDGPLVHYPQASISGGAFSRADSPWPKRFRDRYFFADFVHGWIKLLAPDHPDQIETFAEGLRRPVDLRFSADHDLYVLIRNAWVIDHKFQEGTGSLLRVYFDQAAVAGQSRN